MVMHIQQTGHQPGMVANPARGQLNREDDFSLSPFTREKLVSRDRQVRPSRFASARSFYTHYSQSYTIRLKLNHQSLNGASLTHGLVSLFSLAATVTASINTVNCRRASPKFNGSRNCVPLAFTA